MRSAADAGAFEEFVVVQTRRLLGFATALTGNPHDAWDLTQEALARTGERWHKVHSNPAAYARTTMVRLNVDRIRRLRRELPLLRAPEHAVELELDGIDPWLLDALASLSPRQRTALALRHLEDLDVAQIAARMGCSVGTAKSHLSRGTERLRAFAARLAQEEAP
ncbi:MAG TPA: sigma-70 family RNA polymerase sigma factor [Nocardioidaceae bacterium]|nr:sigma-70 family RNA polymerase sigma factor [Nocardioidaceae bacterium]